MSFLNANPQAQQQITQEEAISRVQRDPIGLLSKNGYNVPAYMKTPEQIIPYLLSSGQITQQQIASLVRR